MVPDWRKIDTVLLDMDGTLLDLHFDAHFWHEHLPARYAEINGITPAAAKQEIMPRLAAMEGALQWYCLDYWSQEFNLNIAELKREIEHMIEIRPHVTTFLQSLRDSGKRVLLTTNAHQDSLSLKMERTSLQAYFDVLVCAHDLGYPKEEQAFWHALHELEPFEPGRTLLIDDNLGILRSAADYGIAYLYGIHQPNSRSDAAQCAEFPQVRCYLDMLAGPGLVSSQGFDGQRRNPE